VRTAFTAPAARGAAGRSASSATGRPVRRRDGVPAERIREIHADLTIVGGRVVYQHQR
jgi:hypothetical protein